LNCIVKRKRSGHCLVFLYIYFTIFCTQHFYAPFLLFSFIVISVALSIGGLLSKEPAYTSCVLFGLYELACLFATSEAALKKFLLTFFEILMILILKPFYFILYCVSLPKKNLYLFRKIGSYKGSLSVVLHIPKLTVFKSFLTRQVFLCSFSCSFNYQILFLSVA
jgi:hypothetical protein